MYQNGWNDALYAAACGLCKAYAYGSVAWRIAMARELRYFRSSIRKVRSES